MVACNDRPRRVNRGFTRFDAALAILQAVPVPLHRHVAPTRDSMRPLPAIVALMLAVASVCVPAQEGTRLPDIGSDRKSTRLNQSLMRISYAVFCLKKKNTKNPTTVHT